MTWYQRITPMQEPYELEPTAPGGRPWVVFNVEIVKGNSETLLEEIVQILVSAGVGQLGVDIFCSSDAPLPGAGTTFLHLKEQSGASGLKTQNRKGPSYPRPTVQVFAIADKYRDARAKARAAFNVLAIVVNQDVVLT